MDVILIYSVLLLLTCGLAVACGVYVLYENRRSELNHLIMFFVFALVIWAFGQALSGAAQAPQVSAIGRRIAPLGWAWMPSLVLHLVVFLTERKGFGRWWKYAFIYLPGFVSVLVFAFFPLSGIRPEVAVRTTEGWVVSSPPDGWDFFYLGYAAFFAMVTEIILIRKKQYSFTEDLSKQTVLLALSVLASLLMAAGLQVLPVFFSVYFPSISAFPMIIFLIVATRFASRNPTILKEKKFSGWMVLSKQVEQRVYSLFGAGLIVCGIILFFFSPAFGNSKNQIPATFISGLLVLMGFSLVLVDFLRLNDTYKEMQVSASLALLTPLLVLWLAGRGLFVAWAIFFPLIVISLVFNRRIILITMIVSSILTTLFQWAYIPQIRVNINNPDYFIRLGILAAIVFFAFYVNRNFTSRLRENINHIHIQTIASEISAMFVSVNQENLDEKLYATLKRCGEFIACDRAYVALLNQSKNEIRHSIEWTTPGTSSQLREFEAFFAEMHPMLMKQLRTEQFVMLRDVTTLPFPVNHIKQKLLSHGIRSMVIVAIRSNAEVIGFLGFNANKPMREWNLDSPLFIDISNSIITDAIKKVEDERELENLAHYDQLTGLPNRVYFNKKLQQSLLIAEENRKMVSVAFLDLDSFKAVNDALGHAQGDRLLKQVAQTLTSVVRHEDIVARFGGDEFILLFNKISDLTEIEQIMFRLMNVLQKPVILDDQEFFVTVSAGIATFPQDGSDPETLIKNADTAMYHAKGSGKNKYVLCSEEMKADVLDRIQLTNLLYRAQEGNQFVLHYQPQVDLESQKIVGLEALIRWNNPEHGLISPGVFIPIAEQTGLIHPIGTWVLEEACKSGAKWHNMGFTGLRMAVNVSAHQLQSPTFVDTIREVLQSTGFPPACLELEVTESVTNANPDVMIEVLQRLKQQGITIAIDDFGTEYSSLSRLKVLPVDRIKIDMQFIQGIEKNTKDQAITKVLIQLAKSLNLKVIAEGLETEPQLLFLYQRMCDEAQGFYFYRPHPEPDISDILLQQKTRDYSGRS